MKKIFLFAIAAVGMTVGCQKIQDILVNPNEKPVDDNSPVEIKFTTNVATVETKAGTGALNALSTNETLYIYGLNRTNPTKRPIENAPASVAVNAGAAANAISWLNESLEADPTIAYFYNGTVDQYDFYGYYVGDAAGADPNPVDYKLDVTIDGQHDILLAKAEGDASAETFSAKTARASITPNLEFKHQLAKFTFSVRNHGNTDITLNDVKVNTLTKGVLTVAETQRGGTNQGLVPTASTEADLDLPNDELELPKRSVNEGTPVDNVFKPVGKTVAESFSQTSLMVFPGQNVYNIDLYLSQKGVDGSRVVTVPFKYTEPIAAGKAYALQITVYSLTEVQITATLVDWVKVNVPEIDTEVYPDVDDDDDTNDDTPTPAALTIDKTAETISHEGGNIVVNASKEATVTIPNDAKTWISCTNVGTAYTFTVAAYDDFEENRVAEVTFTSGEETCKLTVTQTFKPMS